MLLLLALACTPGEKGLSALLSTDTEPPGEHCPDGGVAVHSGVDDDDDGVLGDDEIDSTVYVCDGADGSSGSDGGSGADGSSALVTTTEEPAGDNCAEGGVRIDTGVDDNGDGVLSADEIDDTDYVCDGADGSPGVDTLAAVSDEDPGDNCPYGGQRVDTGPDADADGVLDEDEIASTSYVCNGSPGDEGAAALVSTADEPAGEHCAEGGLAVSVGTDDDGDGVLSTEEVDTTSYVCDGEDGADGAGSGGGIAGTIVAGDYTVANSLDAALLDGVEQITGTLTIYGASIGDVDIPDLVEVGGLNIGETTGSSKFSPDSLNLPSLTTVAGNMKIYRLSLADWSGLDALETVTGTMTVYGPILTTLDAFPNLSSVTTLSIQAGSGGMTELAGFDSLDSSGATISLDGGSTLTSITGFAAMTQAAALSITGTAITDISGLASLERVTGTLTMTYVPITSLGGLASLSSLGGLTLGNMSNLADLLPFSRITSLDKGLSLTSLSSLTSLGGLAGLVSASTSISLYSVPISDLSPLSGITSTGQLTLSYMTALTSLDGLEALDITDTGGITLSYNSALTDISGLSGVTGPLQRLYITSNTALTSLDGLEGITSLGYSSSSYTSAYILELEFDTALTDIDGLYGLSSLGYGIASISYDSALCNSAVSALKSHIGTASSLATWSSFSDKSC